MAKKSIMSKVGVWSYVAGIALALIFGLIALIMQEEVLPWWAVVTLVVLGVVVGLLNISDEEVQMFLLGSVAFVISASSLGTVFASLGSSYAFLQVMTYAIVVFTAPGALVVAFKALYNAASDD